jgi:hypothetical protein
VLGLRLAHGRAPTDSDVDVVLVNETLARELFGREAALRPFDCRSGPW